MLVFKTLYWVGILMQIIIRAPFENVRRRTAKTEQRVSRTETVLLGLLSVGMLLIPLVYSATAWLDFANYDLPLWLGWLGAVFLAGSLFVFARAHIDLKSNWSPSLEIFEGHNLVTNGIYARIRHPMYASQWLWVVAQILLLQSWIAGPVGLVVFAVFYFLRVRAEEKLMLDTFGEQYRSYVEKTGSVIPRF